MPPVPGRIRSLGIAAALAVGAFGVGVAAAPVAPVGAQTTTTTSTTAVPSIPVTPAPAATSASTTSAPLAETGLAADKLVPLGFLLIALGSLLTSAARRFGRPAFRFLSL